MLTQWENMAVGLWAISLALMVYRVYYHGKAFNIRRWPTAEGTIILSRIKPPSKLFLKYSQSPEQKIPEGEIWVRFTVDGTEFERRQPVFGDWRPDRIDREMLSIYAEGTSYPIHYNPRKPSEAYLAINLWWPLLSNIFAVGFVLLSAALTLKALNN